MCPGASSSCWMGTSEWEGRTTKRRSPVLSVRGDGQWKGGDAWVLGMGELACSSSLLGASSGGDWVGMGTHHRRPTGHCVCRDTSTRSRGNEARCCHR